MTSKASQRLALAAALVLAVVALVFGHGAARFLTAGFFAVCAIAVSVMSRPLRPSFASVDLDLPVDAASLMEAVVSAVGCLRVRDIRRDAQQVTARTRAGVRSFGETVTVT